MNVAVLIPARGGSTGLHRKNLQPIGGISLVGRAITTALAVTKKVFVSTEDFEIAGEALKYGAGVVQRPMRLATSEAVAIDVAKHALATESALAEADVVCQVQCTAPLMTADDIRRTADAALTADLAVAVVPFHGVVVDANGGWLNVMPGDSPNRQQRPPQFRLAGSVWAYRPDYLQRQWGSGKVHPVLADNPTFLDIDTPEDIDLARKIVAGSWVESYGASCAVGADVFPNWQGGFDHRHL